MKTTDPSTTNIPPAEGALTSSSVTAKGFLVGAICSGIIGAGVVYADNTIRGSYLALDFASPTALVTLFFLALLLNPILSRLRRTWALSTADVAVVYIMGPHGGIAAIHGTHRLSAQLFDGRPVLFDSRKRMG